jgi:hypothetical protein
MGRLRLYSQDNGVRGASMCVYKKIINCKPKLVKPIIHKGVFIFRQKTFMDEAYLAMMAGEDALNCIKPFFKMDCFQMSPNYT